MMSDTLKTIFRGCDIWSFEDVPIQASKNHTVLFQLPIRPDQDLQPFVKRDIWGPDHVRMPNNDFSKYAEIDEEGNPKQMQRWDLIETSLLQKFENSYQLESAIKRYNTKYENSWDFSSLHHLIQKDFNPEERTFILSNLVPKIINLALSINDIIKCPIPLLKQGMNHSISMTQEQAGCLLANAFLCTFPRRNTENRNAEFSNYPEINFNRLFGSGGQKNRNKLKCILNYFKQLFKIDRLIRRRVITFERRFMEKFPDWKENMTKLSSIDYVVSDKESIEESHGCLQVDFANKFIGGGVLGHGSVQEEIRFVINPELIVSRLFTECLDDRECLIINGTEQFSQYSGYASSFEFAGFFKDRTPFDSSNRRKCRIVAIDAKPYRNNYDQFKEWSIVRDINKAYLGFLIKDNLRQPVATGLWGAGAFNGHPIRSALIQFMACAATGNKIVFYTFGDSEMKMAVGDIFQFLTMMDVKVGELFEILKRFMYSGKTSEIDALIPFVKKEVMAKAKDISGKSFNPTAHHTPPSTSSSDNKQSNSGFKQTSMFTFIQPKKKETRNEAVIEIEDDDEEPMEVEQTLTTRFNNVDTANNRHEQNFTPLVNCPIFSRTPRPLKDEKPRKSLLESLNDDFDK